MLAARAALGIQIGHGSFNPCPGTAEPRDVLHVPKLARRAGSGGSCQ